MWEAAWEEIRISNPECSQTTPPVGSNSDLAILFMDEDSTPVAINVYSLESETVAVSRFTYVKPEYRLNGISRQSWDLAHESLRKLGITEVYRPVTATPNAGKLACESYGFTEVLAFWDSAGTVNGYLMKLTL